MRRNMRTNKRDALSEAVWDLGVALSVVLLSAGVALSLSRVALTGRPGPSERARLAEEHEPAHTSPDHHEPGAAARILPAIFERCPPQERLDAGWRYGFWPPPHEDFEVDRHAKLRTKVARVHPEDVTRTYMGDEADAARLVLVQFVVDTTGRAIEGSLKVLNVGWPPYRERLEARLGELPAIVRRLRYRPAEQPWGRKVCQVVQQQIEFELP